MPQGISAVRLTNGLYLYLTLLVVYMIRTWKEALAGDIGKAQSSSSNNYK